MGEHIPNKFTIIRHVEDDSKRLLDIETGEIILSGDYYHDHIDEQIVGFLQCMDYFGYAYSLEQSV